MKVTLVSGAYQAYYFLILDKAVIYIVCKQRRINRTPYKHRVGNVSEKIWKRRNRHVSV